MMPENIAGLRKTILVRFSAGFLVVALMLFIPAGSLHYWQAWAYLGVLFAPLVFVVNYFLKRDPGFLERRMRVREKEASQQKIQILGDILFFLGFLIPGLDYRFGWSSVPVPLVLTADAFVFLGYLFIFLVFRENSYASRIIRIRNEEEVLARDLPGYSEYSKRVRYRLIPLVW
jgi:protein-S-isoprenylcysteine O-methyltransferase Ste14